MAAVRATKHTTNFGPQTEEMRFSMHAHFGICSGCTQKNEQILPNKETINGQDIFIFS